MNRDQIIEIITNSLGQELLVEAAKHDENANGVQIFGSEAVSKIALGVSCNEAFLEKAVDWGAQMCIFHHGLDTRTYLSLLPIYLQKQLKLIFNNNLTILGFHYALDVHPTMGNNVQLANKLQAKVIDKLFHGWGVVAQLETPRTAQSITMECEKLFEKSLYAFGNLEAKVSTIGIVTGAGKPYAEEIAEMKAKGVQLYISGETSESAPNKMISEGIPYLVCGHYATETLGIKALGAELATQLDDNIEIKFIEMFNPI